MAVTPASPFLEQGPAVDITGDEYLSDIALIDKMPDHCRSLLVIREFLAVGDVIVYLEEALLAFGQRAGERPRLCGSGLRAGEL